jgi:tetratricopeptide (TPR) repeat protein
MPQRFIHKFITLLVLFGVLGSSAVFAEDPFRQVPAFDEGVRGIVLVNGDQGKDLNRNQNIIRFLNDYQLQDVMALNIAVTSIEQARSVRDHYNADLVAWHEFAGDVTRLNVAFFPRAEQEQFSQSDFARSMEPTLVSMAFAQKVGEQSAMFLYGLEQYRAMDYYGAITTFDTMLADASDADDVAAVYLYRGFTKMASYDMTGAIADFEQVSPASDLAAYAQYHLGNAQYGNGYYAEAITAYTQAIASAEMPLLHFAYATRGYLHELSGNPDAAMADYTSATDLDNTNASVYYQRAIMNYLHADFNAALKDFDRLLALSPSNLGYWQLRGMTYVMLGEYDRAVEDYTTAVVLANENAILCQCLYAHRGDIYYIAGRLEEAVTDYNKSLTYGETVAAHVGLAIAYTDMGKTADAKREIELAEGLSSGSATDNLALGVAYDHTGNDANAGTAFWQWVLASQYETITESTEALTSPAELSLSYGRSFHIPVTLKAGQTLNARTFGDSVLLDTLIVVLDNESNPVAGNDNRVIGKDYNAEVNFTAEKAGNYTLVVTHADGVYEGMFTLTWRVK